MRILIASDWYLPHIGGVEVSTQRLAQALAALGHTVELIVPSTAWRWYDEQDGPVRIRRVPAVRYPATDIMVPILRGHRRRIRRMVVDFKPDVVHINDDVLLAKYVLMQCDELGIPTVAVNHTMADALLYHAFGYPRLYNRLTRRYWRRNAGVYNHADLVVAPTQTALTPLVAHGLTRPTHPISNGVDVSYYGAATNEGAAFVASLNLGDDPVFLYIGRLDLQKRIHLIIRAFAAAAADTPTRLVIVGEGPIRKELERLAKSLGVVNKVVMTGSLRDDSAKRALLQRADCFVIASLIESQSIATLEAMAAGLPVIAVNYNALPELVHDGKNGQLFEPDNTAQLTAAMTDMLHNPQRWKRYGQASKKHAQAHDIADMPSHYVAAYKEAVALKLK